MDSALAQLNGYLFPEPDTPWGRCLWALHGGAIWTIMGSVLVYNRVEITPLLAGMGTVSALMIAPLIPLRATMPICICSVLMVTAPTCNPHRPSDTRNFRLFKLATTSDGTTLLGILGRWITIY